MAHADPLQIGRFGFGRGSFLGTGKYKDVAETRAALERRGRR